MYVSRCGEASAAGRGRSGVGRCVYVDQDVYEGEWRADMRHGWGRLRWADGGMYQGSWVKVGGRGGVRGVEGMK